MGCWSCPHFTDEDTEAQGAKVSEFEPRPTGFSLYASSPREDNQSDVNGDNGKYQTLPISLAGLNFLQIVSQNLKLPKIL